MMYIWGKMEDWYVWNMSEFYLILRWVASQWATIDIYIFLKISVDVRGRQGESVSRLSIFMTSPGRGKPQGVFSQVGENHFHSTGCTFCTVYSQDLSKGGKQVCLVFLGGRWRRHLLHWLFNGVFPERLGEGRFLGAVSLSSMTSLAWFKLLNLNLLDLTCLTW